METNNRERERLEQFRRRKFMAAIGASGIVGLAGCVGNDGNGNGGNGNGGNGDGGNGDGGNGDGGNGDGGNGDGGNGDGGNGDGGNGDGGEPMDSSFTGEMENTPPEEVQFNLYSTAADLGDMNGFVFDRLAIWNDSHNEFLGQLATDWGKDDGSFVVEIYDGQTWQNGDPVTADDVARRLTLDQYFADPLFELVDEVQATDDTTIEATLTDPNLSESLVERQMFRDRWIFTSESAFGDDVEALEEASSEDERNSILSEIGDRRIEETDEVGTGPFVSDGHDDQRYYLALRDDYENQYMSASDLSFDQVDGLFIDSRQRGLSAWRDQTFDGSAVDMPQDFFEEHLTEDWVYIKETPLNEGHGLNFNFDDPVYGKREVRQAICYVLDRPAIKQNAPYLPMSNRVIDYNIGLVHPVIEEWVDTSVLIDYRNADNRMERAEELMREAGFEKSNGQWTGEIDGESLEASVKIPPYWQRQGRTATDQLQEFGFPLDTLVQEGPTFWADQEVANFRISSSSYGGGFHPWIAYSSDQGFSETMLNYPREVEVPEVGNLDGSTITVNIDEELAEMKTASEERTREIATKLAWVWNVDVPFAQYFDFIEATGYTHHEWDAPSVEEEPDIDSNVVYTWMFKRGLVDAKTQ